MPWISMQKNTLTNTLEPAVSDCSGEFEPGHSSDDFVISAEGVLKKYRGVRSHVIIPKGVQSIGEGAFQGHWLKSVTIPKTVNAVSKRAFYNCRYLTSIYFEESKALYPNPLNSVQEKVYLTYLTIDEEAFAFEVGKGIDRCILLPRQLRKMAPSAFTNAKNNEFLIYANRSCFKIQMPSEKDYDHLYPYYDAHDVEDYIVNFEKYKEQECQFETTFINNKVRRIQNDKLKEVLQSRDYYTRMLAQKTGLFQGKERKRFEQKISECDAEIARVNREIKTLEAEIPVLAAKRDEAVAKFKLLSREEQIKAAEERFKKDFCSAVAAARKNFLFLQEKQKELGNDALLQSLTQAAPTASNSAASYPTYVPDPNYSIERGRTFTGNQLEDYGKLREKILSGEITTSELREYEFKWGDLP